MTGQEYAPGTVVSGTVNDRPNVHLVAGWSRHDPQLRWCELSPRWGDGDDDECWFLPQEVTDVRRLVVLDPEDFEQMERLTKAFVQSGVWKVIPADVEDTHAHRREQVTGAVEAQTKPPEPEGLYAVVETSDGGKWFHARPQGLWHKTNDVNGTTGHKAYGHLDVVRVLSEGVTA